MRNIFIYILSFFTVASCTPSLDESGDFLHGVNYDWSSTDGNNGSTLTRYLSNVTSVASDGEKTTADYSYNGNKLIGVKTVDDYGSETVKLTYNGDLVSQMEITNVESGTTEVTNLNLVYDAGKLKSVTGTTESGGTLLYKSTTDVTYNSGNKVSKVLTKMNSEDPDNPGQYILEFEVTSDITYNANNISLWKLSTTSVSGGPITIPPIVIESALSNYDSSKNPFGDLPMAYNILSTHYNTSNQGILGLSANNYKNVKITTMGIAQSVSMTYKYNTDNYPTEMTSNLGDKITFKYK